MRCPHHSWREMHQSRMFSIQLKNVLFQLSGTNWMRPSFTAAMAFSASGFVFTNHCVEIERLHDGAAAVALAEGERVRLHFFEQALFFKIGDDALARLKAVQSGVRAGFGGHARVFADHLDLR